MGTTEHVVDRTGWAPGPWDGEPDRVEWRSETGLTCLVLRALNGVLCGYVAVPPGHPFHGTEYTETPFVDEVHGGLTYSNKCSWHICHVPAPGEPDAVWWFGFDCGHVGDMAPGVERFRGLVPSAFLNDWSGAAGEYRTVDYVRAECESLAAQLAALGEAGQVAT